MNIGGNMKADMDRSKRISKVMIRKKSQYFSLSMITTVVILGSHLQLHAQTNLEQGLRLEKEGKYIEAAKVYESMISHNPRDPAAHFHLGTLILRQFGDIDKATDHLEEAVKSDDGNGEYHFALHEAYVADILEASIFRRPFLAGRIKAQLELAVKCDPNCIPYRERLMGFYIRTPGIFGGSSSKGRLQADTIANIDSYSGLLAYAQIFVVDKKDQEAEGYFQKAIATRADDWRAYHRYGYYFMNKGEYDEAITQFKIYVQLAGDTANSYHSLGEGYQKKNMYDSAIALYQRALQIDSRFSPALYTLGQCYELKGKYAEAIRAYQGFILLTPFGSMAKDSREKIQELSDKK
jgi:tetratricopeptide (TPR) repeat protein